jgi:hypothetical protein
MMIGHDAPSGAARKSSAMRPDRRVMFVHDPNADSSSSYGSGPASLPPDVYSPQLSFHCTD